MDSTEKHGYHNRDLAQRFLQTAVVVDDEAYMESVREVGPTAEVVVPNRHTHASNQDDQDTIGRSPMHSLDAQAIMNSFSRLGVICGVVGPEDCAMEAMRKADIVILDWLLQDASPQYALELLGKLLSEDRDRNALRLVSIYTGEAQLEKIHSDISEKLKETGLNPGEDESKTSIPYRHGRVVLYAKSGVGLMGGMKHRSLAEEDLPEKLVEDFSAMTSGLLPDIALTSLTAVREGAHMVLNRFSADLDPAFLAQRVCLSNPDDAEQQIVSNVAEELRGLMDNAVAKISPAGPEAIERWIRGKGNGNFNFGRQNLDLAQTISLATEGLDASAKLRNNDFECLSAGFSGKEVNDLDERLAWIMSFRTVYSLPSPILWLGTIVTELSDGDDRHLVCVRPRCDCVRLTGETAFLFLPLVKPKKGTGQQIVVKLDDIFERLGIKPDSADWVRRYFTPLTEVGPGPVTAAEREPDGGFEYTDTSERRYVWRGELKSEYAQRIAQDFAAKLGRVAVDESEWLRRISRK